MWSPTRPLDEDGGVGGRRDLFEVLGRFVAQQAPNEGVVRHGSFEYGTKGAGHHGEERERLGTVDAGFVGRAESVGERGKVLVAGHRLFRGRSLAKGDQERSTVKARPQVAHGDVAPSPEVADWPVLAPYTVCP